MRPSDAVRPSIGLVLSPTWLTVLVLHAEGDHLQSWGQGTLGKTPPRLDVIRQVRSSIIALGSKLTSKSKQRLPLEKDLRQP